ncbi:MAG: NYN domain-containing protein [Gammaproteobacteria bacterium]
MAARQDTENMALYCDFENIALGVRDAKLQKFDIRKVIERLLLKGNIVVKKAYCDWDRYKDFNSPHPIPSPLRTEGGNSRTPAPRCTAMGLMNSVRALQGRNPHPDPRYRREGLPPRFTGQRDLRSPSPVRAFCGRGRAGRGFGFAGLETVGAGTQTVRQARRNSAG